MSQLAFDPLEFGTAAAAKAARDARYLELKRAGHRVTRFRLNGQLRKYESFGVPDGRIRTVYYVQDDA